MPKGPKYKDYHKCYNVGCEQKPVCNWLCRRCYRHVLYGLCIIDPHPIETQIWFKKQQRENEKARKCLACENCGNPHDGNYGSARFCSQKCARSFSTKEVKAELSHVVSRTMTGAYLNAHPEIRSVLVKSLEGAGSMTEAAKRSGMGYLSFRKYAKEFDLWKPSPSSFHRSNPDRIWDYLNGAIYGQFHGIKARLLKLGIKENKCEKCSLKEWLNKPLTCELDHIDGDTRNNRLSNLRMLCPNCHSQTPTFRAKNKRKGFHS